jgi:hypothetical protein
MKVYFLPLSIVVMFLGFPQRSLSYLEDQEP